MPQLHLPANVRFSGFRPHPTERTCDEFDIIVNDSKIHTIKVDCSRIMDSSSEAWVYHNAYRRGKRWLMEHHLLPIPA